MNRRVARSLAVSAVVSAVSIVGCSSSSSNSSSNPSAANTVTQFVNGYCEALQACLVGLDAGAVLTMANCVTAFTPNPLPSGTEVCSQDQIDQCLTDIRNAMCSTLSPTALMLPGSCKNC